MRPRRGDLCRITAIAAAAVVLALALPAFAAAEATVTITPPGGALVDSLPNDLRIAETQPTFLVSGSEAGTLRCNLDNAVSGGESAFAPCGAPPPTCATATCQTYTPPTLASGPHVLTAELETHDAEGNRAVARAFIPFVVDLTPPGTEIEFEGDERPYPIGPPKPWSVPFAVSDDDPLARADSVQCSFGKAGAAPAWQTCATGVGPREGGSFDGPPVPNRHQDYRLEVRAIDDFGRADPTPAAYEFDPVPCVLRKVAPVSIPRLIAKGLSVTVTCSLAGGAEAVQAYFLGKAGGHILSPRKAILLEERPPVAERAIRHLTHTFTRHLVVPLASVFKSSFRGQRDDVLWVTVGEEGLFEPYDSGEKIHVRG